MFDFNSIGIKGPEDLQEALQVETSYQSFVNQMTWYIEKYGLESGLTTLGMALCGDPDWDLKPLIKFTKRFDIENCSGYDDPRLIDIKE